jgi:hypothetical protein
MENLVHPLVNDVHLYVVLLYLLFQNNQLDDQLIMLLLDLHHMHVELIQQHVYVQQIGDHNHFSFITKKQILNERKFEKDFLTND